MCAGAGFGSLTRLSRAGSRGANEHPSVLVVLIGIAFRSRILAQFGIFKMTPPHQHLADPQTRSLDNQLGATDNERSLSRQNAFSRHSLHGS